MARGAVLYQVSLDTEGFNRQLAQMEAALSKVAAAVPDEPIGRALLGAAAAAVLLPKPVSRRRLLFPWLRG